MFGVLAGERGVRNIWRHHCRLADRELLARLCYQEHQCDQSKAAHGTLFVHPINLFRSMWQNLDKM